MSPREKKLLTFFATAAFLLLNFLGFRLFADHRTSLENKRSAALVELETAERFRASSEEILDEMDWLAEHEPEPALVPTAPRTSPGPPRGWLPLPSGRCAATGSR